MINASKRFQGFQRLLILSGVLALTQTSLAMGSSRLPDNYESWSGWQKRDFLWQQRIVPSGYKRLPSLGVSPTAFLSSAFKLALTFDHVSDEMPRGRKKFIHTFGVAGLVRLEPAGDSPFTGLFRGGYALARLSLAAPPSLNGSYTPGMAIKFFVDGAPSRNAFVMNSVMGQGEDHDFFARTFSNKIPPVDPSNAALVFLDNLFKKVRKNTTHLPMSHLAKLNPDGTRVTRPLPAKFGDYRFFFVPARDVRGRISPKSRRDFREELLRVRAGSTLYDVYAGTMADFEEQNADELIPVGRLVLESDFVASKWGDEKLFFRHAD